MVLFLIRHGESEADILNVHEGRADFELTERGHAQAKAMSKWLHSRYSLDKIYSSPQKRASQTAGYLKSEYGHGIVFDDMLMEFNNGLLAGLPRSLAAEKYPKIENLPVHESVYEQESQLQFRFRAESILSKIISENESGGTVAVVSHGGTINQLYTAFLKLPLTGSTVFPTGDTGIHRWEINGDSRLVRFSNSLAHLD